MYPPSPPASITLPSKGPGVEKCLKILQSYIPNVDICKYCKIVTDMFYEYLYIHLYAHTYKHKYKHAHIYTYTHKYLHTYLHKYIYTHI